MKKIPQLFKTKTFLSSLTIFILINILLYSFIIIRNQAIKFNEVNYLYMSHHYEFDPRASAGDFDFLTALGNYDAQWYLRIAESGYPSQKDIAQHPDPRYMGELSYAFFPLYPMILYVCNLLFRNIQLTAFIIANIFLLANFISLYYVITKLYSEKVAQKTNFLLFLYPFSIFFRSYFTEGTFLFLLIWFSYFLIKRKWLLTSLSLALLAITRPNGIFLILVLLFFLIKSLIKKEISIKESVCVVMISLIPFIGWLHFNYKQLGNPFIWYKVEAVWYNPKTFYEPIVSNIKTIISFGKLPFHNYHQSKVDASVVLLTLFLIIRSRKYLKTELWLMSIIICFVPLVIKDLMSYARYEIVSFPLFLYVAANTNKYFYTIILTLCAIALLVTSIYFVNWYWIG